MVNVDTRGAAGGSTTAQRRLAVKPKLLALALAGLPAVAGLVLWWVPGGGLLLVLLRSYAVVSLTVAFGWILSLALRRFLWRVGHRMAFSYFLIGVVPIPLFGLLMVVGAYIANGFFLGHLYRDAVHSVASELRFAAQSQIQQIRSGRVRPARTSVPVSFAYYRDGRRIAGEPEAPRHWQEWWVKETIETAAPSPVAAPYVAERDGRPTLMAAVAEERYGVLALYRGDLERELSERSGVWVELLRSDEAADRALSFTFEEREFALRMPRLGRESEELRSFFHPGVEDPGLLDRPSLVWAEISRPFLDLGAGTRAAEYVYATLTGSPRTILFHLISRSAEVDTFAYLVLFALAFALFDIWVLAAMMALLMIAGLSRAVNQMSGATARRVRRGDFTPRIEVRRRDQLGELQLSFNQMTANLEKLVVSAAQKESLERELEIARELQESLLPGELETDETLSFATHFAPSEAIGGDYYDVLPVADGRLAVVVADVSGHGVAAGLRMAMIKSALLLLAEQESDPREILRRLHRLQKSSPAPRGEGSHRGFVTATLALIDRDTGAVEITNAGHSPTYLWRRGEVTEIVLPSLPLGALDGNLCRQSLELEPGDALVWLSDGLIEAIDGREEPFGYDAVVHSLEDVEADGDEEHAAALRDHLLAALEAHTGGGAPEDDRTLVVMVYRPPLGAAVAARSAETISSTGRPSVA